MITQTAEQAKTITVLLNGTNKSLKSVVPIEYTMSKPALIHDAIYANFGVLIGITGDLKGKLVLSGDINKFGAIGEAMFGTEISDEMLVSFSGELGNMIAGNLSTNIMSEGVSVDITSPSIIEGQAKISGFKLAINLKVSFSEVGEIDLFLMLD